MACNIASVNPTIGKRAFRHDRRIKVLSPASRHTESNEAVHIGRASRHLSADLGIQLYSFVWRAKRFLRHSFGEKHQAWCAIR
jgi:hypothetical protein